MCFLDAALIFHGALQLAPLLVGDLMCQKHRNIGVDLAKIVATLSREGTYEWQVSADVLKQLTTSTAQF